jgi:heme-degrading monooxygenase HmoA
MHARVVTVQFRPGTTDQAVRVYQESVVPAAQQEAGFKGALLLTDPETSQGISISLWESEADLLASEASGYYQAQIDRFAGVGFFAGPPDRTTYEVGVQV